MSSEKCGATCSDGSTCEAYAMDGRDRCRHHGGKSTGPKTDGGKQKAAGNSEKHGLTAEREKWFERHRDDVAEDVRLLVESYVEDAPFGFENHAKVDQLTELCIDQVRLREANEWLREEFLKEETVGVSDDGRPIKKLVENPAHMPRDRIKRTNIKGLKELGVLDDPESAKGEGMQDLAAVIAENADE